MRTNINLVRIRAYQKPKLFGYLFTKGDIVTYWDRKSRTEKQGVYITHSSFSTWHNGIEYPNNRHAITIITSDGTKTSTDWIKPVQETK